MSLESPNFKAAGNIYPSRFVEIATQLDQTANAQNGFYVEECVTQNTGTTSLTQPLSSLMGISDEAGRDARTDVTNGQYAAIDGDNIKVYGEGSSPVLLEMAATCNQGALLRPNVVSGPDGRGVPVSYTTGAGRQWFSAIALEPCSGVGQKIHVQVKFGIFDPLAT